MYVSSTSGVSNRWPNVIKTRARKRYNAKQGLIVALEFASSTQRDVRQGDFEQSNFRQWSSTRLVEDAVRCVRCHAELKPCTRFEARSARFAVHDGYHQTLNGVLVERILNFSPRTVDVIYPRTQHDWDVDINQPNRTTVVVYSNRAAEIIAVEWRDSEVATDVDAFTKPRQRGLNAWKDIETIHGASSI